MRALVLLVTSLFLSGVSAQDYGFDMEWTHDLTPTTISVTRDSVTYPAHRIAVYEADKGETSAVLKQLLGERSARIDRSGDRLDVKLVTLEAGGPYNLLCAMNWDKKRVATDLDLVVLDEAGSPLEASLSKGICRDLAVQANKRVVELQLEEVQSDLDKLNKEFENAGKDQEKAIERSEDLSEDMERARKKAEKNLKEAEALRKDIAKLQTKHNVSKDPKTLAKIADKQKQLAKIDARQMDLMEDQEKASKKIDKASDDIPDAADDVDKAMKARDELAAVVSALEAKLAAIH
ncbi:MAG: hypothetical protein KDB88_07745 [Flavobacteriales bacterium]|nr:hypothetical protein [Flavobacteriales bacterium]